MARLTTLIAAALFASSVAVVVLAQTTPTPTAIDTGNHHVCGKSPHRGGPDVIPLEMVNDDYCDCADGSDEPDTSACAGIAPTTSFGCSAAVVGQAGVRLPASRVGDGVCDCCDGSDELGNVECPNTCDAQVKEAEARTVADILRWEAGVARRRKLEARVGELLAVRREEVARANAAAAAVRARIAAELAPAVAAAEAREAVEKAARADKWQGGALRRALRVDEHYGLGDAANAANADADARAHAADELASALVRLALRAAPSTEQGTEALLALALGALPESVADDVDDVEVLDIGVGILPPPPVADANNEGVEGETGGDGDDVGGGNAGGGKGEADAVEELKAALMLRDVTGGAEGLAGLLVMLAEHAGSGAAPGAGEGAKPWPRLSAPQKLLACLSPRHAARVNAAELADALLAAPERSDGDAGGADAWALPEADVARAAVKSAEAEATAEEAKAHTAQAYLDGFGAGAGAGGGDGEGGAAGNEDLGQGNALYALKDQCPAKREGQYKYTVCLFQHVMQDHTALGTYSRDRPGSLVFVPASESGTGDPEYRMKFANGQYCGAHGSREATVRLTCSSGSAQENADAVVVSVGEPDICKYEVRVATAAACTDAHLAALRARLDRLRPGAHVASGAATTVGTGVPKDEL